MMYTTTTQCSNDTKFIERTNATSPLTVVKKCTKLLDHPWNAYHVKSRYCRTIRPPRKLMFSRRKISNAPNLHLLTLSLDRWKSNIFKSGWLVRRSARRRGMAGAVCFLAPDHKYRYFPFSSSRKYYSKIFKEDGDPHVRGEFVRAGAVHGESCWRLSA